MKSMTSSLVLLALGFFSSLALMQPSQAFQVGGSRVLLTPEHLEILGHMSLVLLDDGQGNAKKTLRITGLNVQIVNGAGSTSTNNGLGNLIVGYQEASVPGGELRTGSHNFVGGTLNSYSSHGGLIVGHDNVIAAPYASVTGGQLNQVTSFGSSVTGGQLNRAEGSFSSVSGGCENTARGFTSKICGGIFNDTQGADSTISGGISNVVRQGAQGGAIAGGSGNVVDEYAHFATVSGGRNRTALFIDDWAAGSLYENE